MSSLFTAIRPLAWDFLPTIVFAVLSAMHVEVTIATAAAVGVGIAEVLVVRALGRPVATLQWAGLGLAVVFWAASILTQDPRFIMGKPTLIYFAVAAVMLKRGWMLRYMPEIARRHGEALMIRWGYVWAGLMAATGLANLAIALWFTKDWPAFIAVFPLASKLTLFAIQYASVRHVVRGKINAERQAEQAAEALAA
jgi:intracellular septation protein